MASTQQKWHKWSVPILMGLNILFLGFMLWQQFTPQKEPRQGQGPNQDRSIQKFLVKELQLNDTQAAEYEALILGHQKQNKANHRKLRSLMDKQVTLIGKTNSKDEIDLIAQEIGNIHADFVRGNAEHFASLKEMLDQEQQLKFESLLKEVLGKMGRQMGPGGRRPPPPRR